MLFSSLLARTSILSCFFFLFLVILSNFLIIPVAKENTRVKFAVTIPTAAPVTVLKKKINTPPLVPDKTIKILCM